MDTFFSFYEYCIFCAGVLSIFILVLNTEKSVKKKFTTKETFFFVVLTLLPGINVLFVLAVVLLVAYLIIKAFFEFYKIKHQERRF